MIIEMTLKMTMIKRDDQDWDQCKDMAQQNGTENENVAGRNMRQEDLLQDKISLNLNARVVSK